MVAGLKLEFKLVVEVEFVVVEAVEETEASSQWIEGESIKVKRSKINLTNNYIL